ncbi:MAG: hypothetical protein JEZ14_09670 [Marinilabiliaceae bacterium]|nr:hypothetical protein [Marinilabiliaceae bacterium]
MKPNVLDDIFKGHLKDQQELPDGIRFNRHKVHASLNERLPHKGRFRHIMAYAALLALIVFSAGIHWYQQGVIERQMADLNNYEQELSRSEANSKLLARREMALLDSLSRSGQSATKASEPVMISLPHLPAVVATHTIITLEQPILLVEVPVQLPNDDIQSNPSRKPELDLPIYYESERLAAVSDDASGRSSFREKLRKAIN